MLRSVQSFPKVYVTILGICLIGCSDSISSPATTDNASALWSVPFNYHAVNLSLEPGSNTVQLTAIPRTSTGAQFRGAESVLYTALDSTVTVSATGLVTAHYVTGVTQVVAKITSNGITVSDTALIRVTPTPLAAPLATLSIQPRPGGLDSARRAVDQAFDKNIPIYATIANNDPVADTICNVDACPLLVEFVSSDTSIAVVESSGRIDMYTIGRVTFYASTFAYGVVKIDSLPFVIGYPITSVDNRIAVLYGGFTPHLYPVIGAPQVVAGVGGDFQVRNFTGDSLEVQFVDHTHGIRVLRNNGPVSNPYQLTNVIATNSVSKTMFLHADSAGTYPYSVKMLTTGATASGTLTVKRDP